ncbi:MAG: hypothetical protein SOZ90_04325 [Candidatus Faecousia sp.]|nr:hypothetical protein [Candidatus Faecousia sp.]
MSSCGARIGLKEIQARMQKAGAGIGNEALYRMAKEGKLPFVTDICAGPNGRMSFLIWRKDFEQWAKEYLTPYGKEGEKE